MRCSPCDVWPNITGGINDRRSDSLWPTSGSSSFRSDGRTDASEDLYAIDAGRHLQANIIKFDASRSSSVYSDSATTVQPSSAQVLMIIRV